jgi:hypothetical protein
MQVEVRMGKFIFILTLGILVALAVLTWLYPSSEDFRAENPFWNGLKSFPGEVTASTIESLDDLPSSTNETILVLIPYLEFTSSELEQLDNFLTLGGTLVIMDDYGYGNDVLGYLGQEAVFTNEMLMDPLFNYKNERLPTITDFEPVPMTEGIESLILNHATTLGGVNETQVVAWSSRFSFLDLNNNDMFDEGESRGPFPVAATLDLDEGFLVIISDPSMLINSMEGMGNNRQFIENIIDMNSPNAELLLDQSHLPEASLDEAKGILETVRSWISAPLGISILVIVSIILALSPVWYRE